MKIGIAGCIATDNIARFLDGDASRLPLGYFGAPLLGTLIGALLERGHHIVAYTTSSDMTPATRLSASGDRFKITYCASRPRAFRYSKGRWGRAADGFKQERYLLSRAIRDDAPDLVHAHWSYEFALAALDTGYPHVITCHDAPQVVLRYLPNAYRLVRYFMAKNVLARANCLTAVSPYLQELVEDYACVPVTVIANPLPNEIVSASRKTHQYDPAHPSIAMVLNGWGKLKNSQVALQAFALLRKKLPDAELWVMGIDFGPGEKADIWARARKLHQGVHFLGRLPYPAILANLSESDLLLHPSLEETFGMSIAEAMALGVPVVGGESSGAVPWVIGAGGIVTDVTNSTAICEAMYKMLIDPELIQQFRTNARNNAINRFDAKSIAEQYESHYQRALSER